MRIDLPHVHSGKVRVFMKLILRNYLWSPPNSTDRVLEELKKEKKPACVIDEIVEGSHQVEILR